MDGKSQTPQEERIKILQSFMPEIFDEGKIDWEKLKATLGEEVNFANERYVLNWAGKGDAFRVMQQPSSATLVPCREESVDFDQTENIFIESDGRKYYETPDFPNKPWRIHDMTTQRSANERPNCFFTIVNPKTKEEYPANPNRVWANNEETFQEYYSANRIVFPGDYDFLNISKPVIRYWKEDDEVKAGENFGKIAVSTKLPDDIGMSQDGTKEMTDLFDTKVFSYPKPLALLKYLIKIVSNTNDIILDFFAGSGTTAHAVIALDNLFEDNDQLKTNTALQMRDVGVEFRTI